MEDEPEASGNSKKRKLTSEESDDDNPPDPELKSKVKKRRKKFKHRTPKVIPHRQYLFRAREACGPPCPVKISSIQDLVFFVALHETGSIPAHPKWCNVPRVEKIQKVVMVFVSGIGATEYTNDQDCFSQYHSLFQHCIETKASGPDVCNMKLPHERLLSVDTPKTKLKQNEKDGNIIFSREDYVLTIDQMQKNDYHLPSDCDTSFLSTKTYEGPVNSTESPMYAVDCEMCQTAEGLELTRISVVDESLNVVYDTLVKPSNPIVDYLTQYSGITAEILKNVTTTLADVQKRLIDLLPPDAILLGHSLENDLRALQLHHGRVIDTSVIYGDIRGALFKSSLRCLAKQYLKKKIQTGNDGHSSIEDARTCMELVQLKIQSGSKFGNPPVEDEGFFEHIACSGKIASMLDYPEELKRFSLGATHAISCRSDEEIVSQAVKLIPSSEILWVHLHEPEMFYKESNSNIEGDQERTWQDVLRSVDCKIKQVHDAIKSQPCYGLLLVMLAGGDQSLVRRLQRRKKTHNAELKKAVKSAGKGLCFIKICRQKPLFQKGMETSGTITK